MTEVIDSLESAPLYKAKKPQVVHSYFATCTPEPIRNTSMVLFNI